MSRHVTSRHDACVGAVVYMLPQFTATFFNKRLALKAFLKFSVLSPTLLKTRRGPGRAMRRRGSSTTLSPSRLSKLMPRTTSECDGAPLFHLLWLIRVKAPDEQPRQEICEEWCRTEWWFCEELVFKLSPRCHAEVTYIWFFCLFFMWHRSDLSVFKSVWKEIRSESLPYPIGYVSDSGMRIIRSEFTWLLAL